MTLELRVTAQTFLLDAQIDLDYSIALTGTELSRGFTRSYADQKLNRFLISAFIGVNPRLVLVSKLCARNYRDISCVTSSA